MGRNCIVYGCSNTQEKGVTLFKFPTDTKLRKEWTKQVQRTRDKWKGPSKYSAVCCEHFTEDCFESISVTSNKLGIIMKQMSKPTAVPTIFPRAVTPKRLRTSSAFKKRERARILAEIVSEASSSHTDAVSDEQSQEADNVDEELPFYKSMAVQVNTRL